MTKARASDTDAAPHDRHTRRAMLSARAGSLPQEDESIATPSSVHHLVCVCSQEGDSQRGAKTLGAQSVGEAE